MSLQNGLIHQAKAYLWTDTAGLDPMTGKALGHVPKGFVSESWPWAAIYAGTMILEDPGRVARRVAAHGPLNPRELLAACVDALRVERGGRLLVAYVDPKEGARLWMIASDETEHFRPYEPEEFLEFLSHGNGAAPPAGVDMANITPETMGAVIDWQIPIPTRTLDSGIERPTIGGNVLEICVSASGVEQRIIREMVGVC